MNALATAKTDVVSPMPIPKEITVTNTCAGVPASRRAA
jgi:hypothetical protein